MLDNGYTWIANGSVNHLRLRMVVLLLRKVSRKSFLKVSKFFKALSILLIFLWILSNSPRILIHTFLSFFLSFSLSFFFFPELKGIFVDPEGFFSFFLLFQWKDSLGYSGLLRNLWCSFWDSLGFLRILSPSIRASEILCDIPEDSLPTLTDSGPFSRPFSRTHSHSIGILFGIGWNNLGFFA